VEGPGVLSPDQAFQFFDPEVTALDDDLRLRYRVRKEEL
jgi:riboflavin biosynthesis pyrimidine reductase